MTTIRMAQIVTLTLALVTGLAESAFAATYKIELRGPGKILSSRLIDTAETKPVKSGTYQHVANGSAAELADQAASCGVFFDSKVPGQTTVLVSLIQANGSTEEKVKSAVSNSGLLTKQDLPNDQQTVLPGSAGVREVVVEAPKLQRSCIVSLI